VSDIAALILAGGKNTPEMRAACGGVENRALVELAPGRTMLDFVVGAVRGGMAGRGRVLVAGEVPTPPGCVAVPGGASLVDTLLSGVAALAPEESRLLVATADIPFLTAEAVVDFLRRAEAAPAHLHYPILDADACAARFPGMRRTTLRIAEGVFTGGNLALLDPAFMRERGDLIRAAYARRKSVVALGRLLGPSLLLRLAGSRVAPGLLSIRHLETAIGRLLGGGVARAVISPFPEIGADVDKPEDLAPARALLETSPRV
jgi:2-phospho-L-lactate guanylyltransferase (CobY/MobA/RfbA family)